VLGVDTATRASSVALIEDGRSRACFQRRSPITHSRRLLPAIEFVLAEADVAPDQLDGLAVVCGPGSFTGLRVGLATVQGLARALGKPVVGVSTLEAYAWLMRDQQGSLVPVLDARRGQVFTARFRGGDDGPVRQTEDLVVSPEEAFRLEPGDTVFFGDALERYPKLITSDAERRFRCLDREPFVAWEVARLGGRALERGEGVAPGQLKANYVRISDAETSGPRALRPRV
jgi:tRNA threonylcarbamoyladenosine biosynthesis protein TsaB